MHKPSSDKRLSGLHQQRGVALITVLLVFALAAIITSEIASRNFRDIRKTTHLINSKQAYHYALAGEQLARQIIARDFIDSNKSDTFVDGWANIDQLFTIENGEMSIEIFDLQGRFNINNLLGDKGVINARELDQFRQLQQQLSLNTDYSSALIDWMDANKTPLAQGAEDQFYESLDYLPANQFLTDRTELRLLGEMNAKDYNKLKEYVTVLPKSVAEKKYIKTKYNLNTLDAKIVKAVLPTINNSRLGEIQQRQLKGGYSSLEGWSTLLAGKTTISGDDFDVKSEFFEVVVNVIYTDRKSVIRSQMHRNKKDGSITIIKRQQGTE